MYHLFDWIRIQVQLMGDFVNDFFNDDLTLGSSEAPHRGVRWDIGTKGASSALVIVKSVTAI
jgi:hypothetical protein